MVGGTRVVAHEQHVQLVKPFSVDKVWTTIKEFTTKGL